MSVLAKYLTLDAVRVDVEVTSRKRFFEEAALAVEAAYGEPHDEVFNALFERERLGSTGLGRGCAVPHGRLAGITEPAVVFLRAKPPVAYDAPDGLPVSLAIAIIVPEANPETHLTLLRETAALFSEEDMRVALNKAPEAVDVCRLIADWRSPFEDENENDGAETESASSETSAQD